MAPHPVTVAPDVDDVAAVQEAVEQRGGHDLVVQDRAPALEALVEVSTFEACSQRRLTSWKKRMALLRVTGR